MTLPLPPKIKKKTPFYPSSSRDCERSSCWIHWNHYVPLTSNVLPVITIDIVCYIMIIQHCMHTCNTRYYRYTILKYIPCYTNLGTYPRSISGPPDILPYYTCDYSSLLQSNALCIGTCPQLQQPATKQCAMYRCDSFPILTWVRT